MKAQTRDSLLAYLPAAVWCAGAVVLLATGQRMAPALALAIGALLLGLAGRERRSWLPLVQLSAAVLALLLALWQRPPGWVIPLAGFVTLGVVGAHLVHGRARLRALDDEQRALRRQVDRRINEIFSLQELSYVLAESLQSDRIAAQVARYVLRFLSAEGAAVLLYDEADGTLRVAAADGSIAAWAGRQVTDASPSLVLQATITERIEVTNGTEPHPVYLLPEHQVVTGLAAPLRAHGLTMGVLAVADRRQGTFSPEDLWLLSTVATHVAVVLANSRLFEMVRQAKEEWETAFNALTEGIGVLDAGGKIARANQALARLLQAPPSALLGQPFWSMVVGAPEGEDALIGAARRGERVPPLQVRSAGTGRMLRLTAAPLAEPAEHAAVVVLVEDVTEQRSLEAQLIQSERLAAVGQLVSGVAHELNNPLTSIAGLSEFLQERAGLARADREHLEVIHAQAERAGRIVRNLLTFARRGTPGDQVVDLNDLVARTALLVGYELRIRGITLREERAAAPLPVRGNADELQQVLLNLVNNAAHAVRGLPPGEPREVALLTAAEDGHAVVMVRDSGAGVPEALAAQIFTPFFTTKEPGEGTGLGLSLSYRIIESHGGRLRHQAPPAGRRGAEFSFQLPLAAAVPDTGRADPAAGGRSLLLIDGDSAAELIARALFEPAGYSVHVARSAADGAARLAAEPWGVVLLDGALSADGAHRLAEELPVVEGRRVLVATGDAELAARSRERGHGTLPRPFLPRDLVAAAGDLLAAPAAQGEVAR
ncbi:MAG: PAS domain-containing protein [Gemmatimonadetes bacterium]|nr:PAS domain-containing protein [Gemmatimonadota bacterium]MBK6780157.1 PAS domain-containing protein [Gemmatimonadota bacterium]MBK7350898.1 PAS domain-containing protein [Gemmatimonadota bacterium]MBK7786058.1 PAS domain-containing protein [Gemmatimonadota bacterium]MBK7922424.1 PAS domain-containing protein [Gemmatimonadota bacterium]